MFHVPNLYRIHDGIMGSDDSYGNNGAFFIQGQWHSTPLKIVASDGLGWEHVSVSLPNRCPNWLEMCFIKEKFWSDEDTVIQYHPPKSSYVNFHPYCLHLWRPTNFKIPVPDSILIGPKKI